MCIFTYLYTNMQKCIKMYNNDSMQAVNFDLKFSFQDLLVKDWEFVCQLKFLKSSKTPKTWTLPN